MSWISESGIGWAKQLGVMLLRCGPIPRHMAFIMDGNRRFAVSRNIPVVDGYREGFKKLGDSLYWLQELGVKEITVFSFSIENFKRTKQEVDVIMDILRTKLKELLSEREKLKTQAFEIHAIGNISLLPDDIIALLAEAQQASTRQNAKLRLNLAVAYTAQEEMTNAVNIILHGLKNGEVFENDFNGTLFSNCLYTRKSYPVEMIIRTSGETRLSDFILFQGSYSYLHFSKSLWPKLSFWDVFWALFKYQRVFDNLEKARDVTSNEKYLTFNSIKYIKSINDRLVFGKNCDVYQSHKTCQ